MIPEIKVALTSPLPSEVLEEDAKKAGVVADEQVVSSGDPHWPASEGKQATGPQGGGSVERDVINLPPD
jgi:hypothetical protein